MSSPPAMQQPSLFGQLIINTYTIILLGFRIPDTTPKSAVVENLNQASLKLTATFPFLAGQVINEGASATSTGHYRTIPYEPHTRKSVVIVKDCEELFPSYDELAAAKVPIQMLDGSILSPKKGFMYQYDMPGTTNPVLLIQANFIKGGLLLCFAAQHNALDMNGLGQCIRLFATACRGDDFDAQHVVNGNMDFAEIARFLKDGERGREHEEMRVPSSLGQAAPAHETVPAPWNVWRFSGAKVAELKARATPGEGAWISTNDAVTALFWQRLTLARLPRFPDVKTCTLIRAINGRRVFTIPAPEGFMGHCVFVYTTPSSVEDLAKAPLSAVAVSLRTSMVQVDELYFRSLATAVRDEPDHTTFSYGAAIKSGLDMLTSSFAGLGLLHCKFGPLLGRAEFARRPLLDEAEGLSYLMPTSMDGGMDLVASLRVEDIEALGRDSVWTEFAEFIG